MRRTLALLLPLSVWSACAVETPADTPGECRNAPTSTARTAVNGIQLNGLTTNGLALNGTRFNGIQLNGFRWNGTQFNGIQLNGFRWNGTQFNAHSLGDEPVGITDVSFIEAMHDAAVAEAYLDDDLLNLLQYAASCALDAEDSFVVELDDRSVAFDGDMGLGAEWADGACDTECQEAVSACLFARVNHAGRHVLISMRGEAGDSLATTPDERAQMPLAEATFYGNLFRDDPIIEACWLPDSIGLQRSCGDNDDCPILTTDWCEDICERRTEDGAFIGCSASDGRVYAHTVSVYRAECPTP